MHILLVFVIASFVVLSEQQTVKETLREWRKLVAPHMNRCLCESQTNTDLAESFFEFGEISNDPCFKCNTRCWAVGIGLLSASGNVNMTVYRSLFGITEDIVQKCGYNTNVDICQKNYEMITCSFNMIVARNAPKPADTAHVIPVVSENPQNIASIASVVPGNSQNHNPVTYSLPPFPQFKLSEALPQIFYG